MFTLRRSAGHSVCRPDLLSRATRRSNDDRLGGDDPMLTNVRQDIVFAVRTAVRSPASVVAIVVTLALGLAVNAVMFDIVDRLLLSPPSGVGDPAGVRRLGFATPNETMFQTTYD